MKLLEEERRRTKFKGSEFFDKKHNKNKFRYLEEQKKEIQLEEINKSIDERGKKDDYDDLKRSIEKAENEKKRIEHEKFLKEKEERERKEQEAKEEEKNKKRERKERC